jgi:hypothetical protein
MMKKLTEAESEEVFFTKCVSNDATSNKRSIGGPRSSKSEKKLTQKKYSL